jgi:glycosyltransferase involved in cell wall biosynthesis
MKGSDLPKVSVCIPTYNHAHFLSDAIDSVLSQSFTNYELIVVDNCSTDNTREIVTRYLKIDDRVKYFHNETNVGLVGNLNRCLAHASGEYVKILCADDLIRATCIGKEVKMLDDNPSVVLVSCARQVTEKNLSPTFTVSYSNQSELLTGKEVIRRCFLEGNLIGEPTAVLFRKKDAMRGFSFKYRQQSDLEMWFHLLEKGDFAFIPEALCIFRQHEGQGSVVNLKLGAAIYDEFQMYRDYAGKPYMGLHVLQQFKVLSAKALFAVNQRDYGVAPSFIKAALSDQFGLPLYYPILVLKKIKDFFER